MSFSLSNGSAKAMGPEGLGLNSGSGLRVYSGQNPLQTVRSGLFNSTIIEPWQNPAVTSKFNNRDVKNVLNLSRCQIGMIRLWWVPDEVFV